MLLRLNEVVISMVGTKTHWDVHHKRTKDVKNGSEIYNLSERHSSARTRAYHLASNIPLTEVGPIVAVIHPATIVGSLNVLYTERHVIDRRADFTVFLDDFSVLDCRFYDEQVVKIVLDPKRLGPDQSQSHEKTVFDSMVSQRCVVYVKMRKQVICGGGKKSSLVTRRWHRGATRRH